MEVWCVSNRHGAGAVTLVEDELALFVRHVRILLRLFPATKLDRITPLTVDLRGHRGVEEAFLQTVTVAEVVFDVSVRVRDKLHRAIYLYLRPVLELLDHARVGYLAEPDALLVGRHRLLARSLRLHDEVAVRVVLVRMVGDGIEVLVSGFKSLALGHEPPAAVRSEVVQRIILAGLLLVLDDGVDELRDDPVRVLLVALVDVPYRLLCCLRLALSAGLQLLEGVVNGSSTSKGLARLVEVELDSCLGSVGTGGLLDTLHVCRMLGDIHLSAATLGCVVLHLQSVEARMDAPLTAEVDIGLVVVVVTGDFNSVDNSRTGEEVRRNPLACLLTGGVSCDMDVKVVVVHILHFLRGGILRHLDAVGLKGSAHLTTGEEAFVLGGGIVLPVAHIVPYRLGQAGRMERDEHVDPVAVQSHLHLGVRRRHKHHASVGELLAELPCLDPVEALRRVRVDAAAVLVCSDGHVDLVTAVSEDTDELR